MQHFDEVKISEKLKEKQVVTVMQMEAGDALVIGLNGIVVFNATLGGKWKTGGGCVYKAPILRVWVTD